MLPQSCHRAALVAIMRLIRLAYEEKADPMLELPGSPPRRRLTLSTLENLLLAIAVIAGAAVGIHALTSGSSPDAPGADAVPPTLSATRSGQADASAPVIESPTSADKQGAELRAQLAQATEQLKSAQGRISELEGQLRQAPSAADLDKAGKQGNELRAQLAQATERLKTSQGRVSQLEAQLRQAPSAADLDKAGKQGAELRAQLAQANEQLKASQGRISQLEGQLKQTPSAADLVDARKEIGDLRSQLSTANGVGEGRGSQIGAAKSSPPGTPAKAVVARANDETRADVSMLLNRGDALLSTGDIASGRLFYQRAAEAGNGQAALRLGNTYDPAFLERAQLRVHGDRALALFWYQRARELGASEAEILLKGVQTQSER
jgi:phage shock protein A